MDAQSITPAAAKGRPNPPPSRRTRFITQVSPRFLWALGTMLVGVAFNWVIFAFLLARPIWVGCFGDGGAMGPAFAHTGGSPGMGILALFMILFGCFPSVLSSLIFLCGFPFAYFLVAKKRVMTKVGQTLFELYRSEIADKVATAIEASLLRFAAVEPQLVKTKAVLARVRKELPFLERRLLAATLKKVPEADVRALLTAARGSRKELDPVVDGLLDRVRIDVPTAAPRILIIINAVAIALAWVGWMLFVKSAGR